MVLTMGMGFDMVGVKNALRVWQSCERVLRNSFA
jgi:hypothetical protein